MTLFRLRPALFSLALVLALPVHAQAPSAPPAAAAAKPKAAKKPAAKPKAKAKSKAKGKTAKLDTTGEHANFANWKDVGPFIDRMVETHGFERAALVKLLNDTRYVDAAIQLVKPAPPGKPKNWQAYRARIVDAQRIRGGVDFWNENADALARAEAQYGVPASIIVGIIGVETFYGRVTGSFRILDAITTLAFDYPPTPNRDARMAMFRGELEQALLYARANAIDPFSLTGSYAGAIGLPQFMPSNIRRYAVDFDGDGKIDLRGSPADAIGSVANFLVAHGWKTGEPYAFPAQVSLTDGEGKAEWQRFIGRTLEARHTLDELRAGGVTPSAGTPLTLNYSLVDLQNGAEATEYWLGAANFFVITHYNRSYFYAMSVVEMARAVTDARTEARGK